MNPATRILRLAQIIKETERSDNKALLAMRSVIQQLTGKKGWTNSQISRFLMTTQDEIDVLAAELDERGVPDSLYVEHLARIRSAIEPTSQGTAWSTTKSIFDAPRVDCLHWASLYLGDEEEEISTEDLEILVSAIDELKAAISQEQIPSALRRSIQKHLTNMENAIEDYPIKGSASIRTALETSTGILHSSKDTYKEAMQTDQGKEVVGSARKMLEKASDLIDAAGKKADSLGKIGSAVGAVFKLLS